MKTHAEAKTNVPARHAHTMPMPNALAHQAQLRGALLRAGVQPRLEIGAVNDPLEREADATAERVLRMPEPESSHIDINGGRVSPKPSLQQIQAKTTAVPASGSAPASPQLESSLNSLSNGGAPLDASTRTFFEPRFGQDFSGVRLHTDAHAARMADSLSAKAFTLGNDIAFATNQYSADTSPGRHLLSHELAHVVQQRGTGGSTPQAKLVQRQTEDSEEEKKEDALVVAAQEAAQETESLYSDNLQSLDTKGIGNYYGSMYDCTRDPACDNLEEINCISFQMKPVEAYIRNREASGSLQEGTWDAIRKATSDSRGKMLRNGKKINNTDVLVGRDTVLMEQLRTRAGFTTVLYMPQSEEKVTHYPSKAYRVKGADTGKKIDVRAKVDYIFTDRKAALAYLKELPFAILAGHFGMHTLVLSNGWVYEAHWAAGPTGEVL